MEKLNKIVAILLAVFLILNPVSVSALTKNETIYAHFDSSGNLIVSSVVNHLNHIDPEIEDETDLKNILNINGKETYQLVQQKLKWNSVGEDIFYQGNIEKEQPIAFEIEYYLDGQKKTPKEMHGKTGTVKIVIKYQNKLNHLVNINGRMETMYTPFVVTTGLVLNNDLNQNIKVENGKSINSGSRTMIIGMSTPGLYESLHREELKNLNTVTITYDTKKFSLGNIYVIATPKLLEETDLEIFEKMNHLVSNMDVLQSSMNQLEAGISKLQIGSQKLVNGTKDISDHLVAVNRSITELKNGSITLEEGIELMIQELNQAIEKVEVGLQVNTLEESKKKLEQLKMQNMDVIHSMLPSGMTIESLMSYTGVDAQVLNAKKMITLLSMNSAVIEEMTSSLDMLPKLVSGLQELKNGLVKVEENLGLLENGTGKLVSGAKALVTGVNELDSGIATLKNGFIEVNQKGIQPLRNYSNLVRTYSQKLEALVKLGEEYQGYACNNADHSIFMYHITVK